MAGARISLDVAINDRDLMRALSRLADFQKREALADIGEMWLNSHRERFAEERAPDGTPWEPLSENYKKRKKKNKDKILILSGLLIGKLRYNIDDGTVEVGTDRIYGASQQFGDPDRNIPARPFLGMSQDDEQQIVDILQEHIRRAVSG